MDDNTIGGGSGADSAPIGTVPAGGGPSTPVSNEPAVVDIPDDNMLIRPKGSQKPIKFGDYSRGFQAQTTKAQQEAATLRRQMAERDAQIQRYEQERERSRGDQRGQQPSIVDELKALPYLDGQQAARVVSGIAGQFQQRDQLILTLAQELQKVKRMAGGLHESHTQASFNSKIDRFLSDGGYGPELKDLATETYLAYEPGADLDQEFPRILSERIEQLQRWVEGQRRTKLEAAKRQPFVPGRGGNTGPQKPLEVKADASPREMADQLFGLFADNPGT